MFTVVYFLIRIEYKHTVGFVYSMLFCPFANYQLPIGFEEEEKNEEEEKAMKRSKQANLIRFFFLFFVSGVTIVKL